MDLAVTGNEDTRVQVSRGGSVGAATSVFLVLAALAADPASSGSQEGTERAAWAPKQVRFVYHGFTTHYSCEGLKEKVRSALLQLGATKDLKVQEGACTRPSGGPEPFPSVDVKMSVLRPQRASEADQTGKAVSAHWQGVEVKLDKDPLSEAADCELVEQIKQTFLPLFATRNVDYQSSCVAHQVSPGGTWLRADVLVADPPSTPASSLLGDLRENLDSARASSNGTPPPHRAQDLSPLIGVRRSEIEQALGAPSYCGHDELWSDKASDCGKRSPWMYSWGPDPPGKIVATAGVVTAVTVTAGGPWLLVLQFSSDKVSAARWLPQK